METWDQTVCGEIPAPLPELCFTQFTPPISYSAPAVAAGVRPSETESIVCQLRGAV